jgi:hypothetical protein
MDNENKTATTKDDFYAVVSAIARFIEVADNDMAPKNEKTSGASPEPRELFEKGSTKTFA